MTARELIERQVAAHEDQRLRDRQRIAGLSLEERGPMIDSVCADVVAILKGRQARGLPPSVPAPWPESTWDLLRKYAPYGVIR
jgi:hypothetical protein